MAHIQNEWTLHLPLLWNPAILGDGSETCDFVMRRKSANGVWQNRLLTPRELQSFREDDVW
jgi:hypothetical protein